MSFIPYSELPGSAHSGNYCLAKWLIASCFMSVFRVCENGQCANGTHSATSEIKKSKHPESGTFFFFTVCSRRFTLCCPRGAAGKHSLLVVVSFRRCLWCTYCSGTFATCTASYQRQPQTQLFAHQDTLRLWSSGAPFRLQTFCWLHVMVNTAQMN